MANLAQHIQAIERTLQPEFGPEAAAQAMDRLHEYYRNLAAAEREGFALALISDAVAQRAWRRAQERAGWEGGGGCGD